MPVVPKDELRRELRLLERVVDEASDGDPVTLAEIHSVLVHASTAVRAIRSRSTSGAYVVPISSERMRDYFPVAGGSRRAVTPEEMREADLQWHAAMEQGRSHRHEALAQVGPVLTPRQAAERLGVSSVTVNNWRRRKKLLALQFDDHQYVYPTFQFAESPSQGEQGVLRQFSDILRLLPSASPWTQARFFLTKTPFLGGRTPLEMLRSGKPGDIERVRLLAPHMGEMGS